MAESPSESTSESLTTTTSTKPAQSATDAISSPQTYHVFPEIPIEIVSEEEMAILDAALAATDPSAIRSASPSRMIAGGSSRNIRSITLLSKRKFSAACSDIEESYLHRFRRNQALSVTDLTGTEWCEKQMENVLCFGRRMKAGQARHLQLEEEVVKWARVRVESNEDKWALKLLNSIAGVNQFLFEGRTRELLLLGFVGGQWIVGITDELRKPYTEESSDSGPILIDTKTRLHDTLPAEPQRRNGRYEFQKDQSIIAEIRFHHDHEWVMSKYREIIEFWRNEREAEYTPEEERWKCRYCQFAKSCPGNPSFESPAPSSPPKEGPLAS